MNRPFTVGFWVREAEALDDCGRWALWNTGLGADFGFGEPMLRSCSGELAFVSATEREELILDLHQMHTSRRGFCLVYDGKRPIETPFLITDNLKAEYVGWITIGFDPSDPAVEWASCDDQEVPFIYGFTTASAFGLIRFESVSEACVIVFSADGSEAMKVGEDIFFSEDLECIGTITTKTRRSSGW